MGIIDTEIKRLHDVVSSLEDRVKALELGQPGTSKSADGVRMILIGPPGAGMSPRRSMLLKPACPELQLALATTILPYECLQ